jgi:hypothetical protein
MVVELLEDMVFAAVKALIPMSFVTVVAAMVVMDVVATIVFVYSGCHLLLLLLLL